MLVGEEANSDMVKGPGLWFWARKRESAGQDFTTMSLSNQ